MSRGINEAVGVIAFPFLSSSFLSFFSLPYSFACADALCFFCCFLFFSSSSCLVLLMLTSFFFFYRKEKNKVSCPHHDVSKASAPLLPKGCIECSRCPAEKWPKRIAEIEQNFIGRFPPFQAPLPTLHSCQIARSHLPAADAELFNYSSSFQNTCAARKSPPKKRVVLFRLLGHFLNLSWILVGHVIVLQLNSSSLTPTPPSKNKGKHIIIRHLLLTVHF